MELQAKEFIDRGFIHVSYSKCALDFYTHKGLEGEIVHYKEDNVFSLFVKGEYIIDYIESLKELKFK